MSFKKPFRAVPVRPTQRYLGKRGRLEKRSKAKAIVWGLLLGAATGLIGIGLVQGEQSPVVSAIKPLAISAGLVRKRSPQVGDYWKNCEAAKAAGTFPIYVQEPGYRAWLDSDGDGYACEPYE